MSQISSFITAASIGAITTLTGNSGGAVSPLLGNIDILGSGELTVTGNPATSTLTVSLSGAIASQYDTDAGSAIPALGVLDIVGSHGINTTGATNVVTVLIDNTITLGDLSAVGAGSDSLTLTTGDLSVVSGNINLPTTSATDGIININSTRFMHSYGTSNTFLGSGSGNFSLTSIQCVGIGNAALDVTTSGNRKIAIGHNAMGSVTSGGVDSIAIGFQSMNGVTTAGNQSIGIGTNCFSNAYTGTDCVAVGYQALDSCTSSDNCIAIGSNALGSLTGGGDNNIAIGNAAGSAYTTESNNITIGNNGTGTDSGVIRIGTNATHVSAFFAGIEGVDVGNVAKVVTIDSDELGSATITAGTNITVTATANTITIDATADLDLTYTAVSSTPYVVLSTDQFLGVDSSGGAIQINLPNAPGTGRVFRIKDSTASAGMNNITVTTVGGVVTIDGATTRVLNINYQSISVIFNGTSYEIF